MLRGRHQRLSAAHSSFSILNSPLVLNMESALPNLLHNEISSDFPGITFLAKKSSAESQAKTLSKNIREMMPLPDKKEQGKVNS